MIVAQGFVTGQESGRRAGEVRVYGVDDRFWQFHGVTGIAGPLDRDALVSPALARDIDAQAGSAVLVRVQRPSEIPLESLHGRKEDLGRTLRLTVRAVRPRVGARRVLARSATRATSAPCSCPCRAFRRSSISETA